jgi:hypothetical protein
LKAARAGQDRLPRAFPEQLVSSALTARQNGKRWAGPLAHRLNSGRAEIAGTPARMKMGPDHLKTFKFQRSIPHLNMEEHKISQIEIKSGPMNVIFSGTVTTFEGNPIELTFGSSNDRLRLIFIFKKDEKGERRMEVNNPDSKSLEISLFNFNSALGDFSIKPMHIGILENRRLFLHLRVYGSGKEEIIDRMLHITLYHEPESVPLKVNEVPK